MEQFSLEAVFMIDKPFSDITADDIQNLLDNHVRESVTIEYKQALPDPDDEAKKEFLADISSFANAAGGDILYGIAELRDAQGRCTGEPERVIGLPGVNLNDKRTWLEQVARTGLDPRIPGIQMKPVDCPDGTVLLVRVMRSWLQPHMITFKNHNSRFFSRHSTGKFPLNVDDLRSAFTLAEGRVEKIKAFRDGRLGRIIAGETPVLLPNIPKLILQLVPIAGFEPLRHTEISLLDAIQDERFCPLRNYSQSQRYNIDGIVKYYLSQNLDSGTYLQVFRNGAVEAVCTLETDSQNTIYTQAHETDIIQKLDAYLMAERQLRVEPPFLVMLSLLGVKDCSIAGGGRQNSIDRDIILLPDALLSEYDADMSTFLQPIFDALWQASGESRCFNYENGQRR